MNAHILMVRLLHAAQEAPHGPLDYIGVRAAILLRAAQPEGSTNRNWIDAGPCRVFGDAVVVVELYCPNHVGTDAVLSAVNLAINSELPWLKNHQWETILLDSIPCMNQDR
jgi:hypothetical protein